jgi:hypothetical protein
MLRCTAKACGRAKRMIEDFYKAQIKKLRSLKN